MAKFDITQDDHGRAFPSTCWSDFLFTPGHPRYQDALTLLVERYWKPIYYYVRTLRKTAEDAEDLTQQFFTMLLSRDTLSKLSPARGRLRGFLKTSLKNFLISAHRATVSRLPQNGFKLFSFEELEHEWQITHHDRSSHSPDEAFDQEWARGVMTQAITQLKAQAGAEKQLVYFHLFSDYYLEPMEGPLPSLCRIRTSSRQPSYGELAQRYRLSENEVRSHLRTARDRIRDIIKGLLIDEIGPGENIEDELKLVFQ